MNVLIPNVGRRGYLVEYLKESPYFEGNVYVSDCDRTASGLYGNNDGYFILSKPVDNEKKYVEELLDLCRSHKIELIIPVIDPELYILSKYKHWFEEYNIIVLVSERSVLEICYNKMNMNRFLLELGYPVIQTYDNIKEFEKAWENGSISFPVMYKPIYGSGSADTGVAKDMKYLKAVFQDGMMIQEYVSEAIEYGIDVFNTFDKVPVRCVIKRKVSMRSGETDKSYTIKSERLTQFMTEMAKKLGHVGNLDCDILEKDGVWYVLDLNPRFGGGYMATHIAGGNLLELTLRMVAGERLLPKYDSYKENVLVMKTISMVKADWEEVSDCK